jgi:hypothetical protein
MANWGDRYGNLKQYRKRAARAHESVNGLCCCCLKRKSTVMHHSSYRKSGDRRGDNWFPICKTCHTKAHSPQNWVKDKQNPIWKNRNTREFSRQLKRGYRALQDKV